MQAQLEQLGRVQVLVRDLTGDRLGLALGGTVLLDVNAAGHGWFIDPTPLIDEEFSVAADSGNLLAIASSAAGRVDLLSVLMHELGHELGYGDLDPDHEADHLMTAALATGVRRLPGHSELDHVFADERLHDDLLAPTVY